MSLLPETVQRVDELVARAQAVGCAPALVAGVVRQGELAHFAGAGELPKPHPDLQFRIGSISKSMTAALVLRARDEGQLELDDLLYRHLPGTPVGGVTLRQLLGHVAGMQREPDGEWWERSTGTDVETFLGALTPDKLSLPPYRAYHYSNLAYGLLGAVLERVTGETWRTLLTKRLLGPLGMTRTSYGPEEPFARGYVVHPWHGTLREEPRPDHGAMAPAGQLWSTVADLARWAAFIAEPDATVLAPGTVDEMRTPVTIADLESWTSGYGLGFQLWRSGDRVYVGHTGSMPGYVSVLMVHPTSRTGVVAFANTYTLRGQGIGRFGQSLLDEVVAREPERPKPWRPGAAPPPDVEPLTGRWWWMGHEAQVSWDGAARELVVTLMGAVDQAPQRFTADGPDRWRCLSGMNLGEVLRVRRGPNAIVQALDIATFVFSRDPWPAI